jgi:RNA polymerase sigma factor (sigma-70 family)
VANAAEGAVSPQPERVIAVIDPSTSIAFGATAGPDALPLDAGSELEQLFLDHGPRLRRSFGARTREVVEADDLCQEAFLRLFLELRAGRRPDRAGAWLYRVAHNVMVSEARRRRTAQAADLGHASEPTGDPTADAVLDRERWSETMAAMATLSAAERSLIARGTGGTSSATMAAHLGTTPLNARMRLHRSRGHLRHLLETPKP